MKRCECLLFERSTKEMVIQTLNITSQELNTVGTSTLPEQDSKFKNLNTSTQAERRSKHERKQKYSWQNEPFKNELYSKRRVCFTKLYKVQESSK